MAIDISMKMINKNGKSLQQEFCAHQMSYEKANTNALWCMASRVYKNTNIPIVLTRVKLSQKQFFSYTFCIITANEPTVEHYFDGIASNNTKMCLEVMFEAMNVLLVNSNFVVSLMQSRDF